mgnify:FL=1
MLSYGSELILGQPAVFHSLACLLTDGAEGLDIPQSLITYPADGFCFVPDEILTEKSIREGLTAYSGTKLPFVGLSESFLSASGDAQPHTLTVMLPRSDYNQILLKSALEIVGLWLLLLFFGGERRGAVTLLDAVAAETGVAAAFQNHFGRIGRDVPMILL